MPLVQVVLILLVVGVLLWLLNTKIASIVDATIVKIINVLVIVAVVVWLLSLFLPSIGSIRIGR